MKVYIGNCSEKGIYQYDLKKGKLENETTYNKLTRCTYICQTKSYIYGVLEVQDKNNNNCGYVVSYKKDKKKIHQIDKKTSHGQSPCHIEADEKRKIICISNYKDGKFVILKMNKDGTIGEKIYSNIENEKNSHVHCTKISKNKKNLFVADLGEDAIIVYEIKAQQIKKICTYKFEKGTEPRHIALGKNNKIYVVTEKTCKMYILKYEEKKIKMLNKISILPKNINPKENYTGSAIKISKNLKKIYITVRGHNSISVIKANGNNAKLIQNITCRGDVPRDLEIDKTGKYILVANSDSNNVIVFKKSIISGKLEYKTKKDVVMPTCIVT